MTTDPQRTKLPDPWELPVGTPVLAWPGSRDERALLTRTRTDVWVTSGQHLVSVDGYAGGIALTHIEVLPTPGSASDRDTLAALRYVVSYARRRSAAGSLDGHWEAPDWESLVDGIVTRLEAVVAVVSSPVATTAPMPESAEEYDVDYSDPAAIEDLIERSSLGTPEAKAARATVSDERAARVVARAHELDRQDGGDDR